MDADRITYGWGWHAARLRAARSYWVLSTSADGQARAAPVWGVWVGGALWFATAATSRKARNLARDPRVTIHLDSSDDVLMLEGTAQIITDAAALREPADAYAAKYALTGGEAAALAGIDNAPVFRVVPLVGRTWLEPAFSQTMTRWSFTAAGADPTPEPMRYD